jgi:hypothetical protein
MFKDKGIHLVVDGNPKKDKSFANMVLTVITTRNKVLENVAFKDK